LKRIFHFFLLLLLSGCANRVTPTGGDKDVKPPQLLVAVPADKTVNFKSKEIRLYFDEYVQLVDLPGQLLISPLTSKMPVVKFSKKSIVITLPDSLLQNTTYTISFGKAIVDVHESNPLVDFQYVFSTGGYLDSLTLEGVVKDATVLTGVKNITALIYRKWKDELPDSMVFKNRPDYFARTNENGEFKVSNMPPGEYKVFAVDDKNNNYKCDNPSDEGLAFQEQLITLPGLQYSQLKISTLEPAGIRLLKPSVMDRHCALISFNKPLDSIEIVDFSGKKWEGRFYQSAFKDSLYLCQPDKSKDSLSLLIYNAGQFVDTVMMSLAPAKGSKEGADRLRIFLRQSPTGFGPESPLILNTNHPLFAMNDSAEVVEDSAKAVSVPLVIMDSLRGYFSITYPWQSGKRYKVFMYPGTIKDIYDYSNDTIKNEFLVPGPESTAILSVKTEGLVNGKNYILQLLNEKYELLREVKTTIDSLHTFAYLTPGSIRLRIIEDINHDGRWTYGNYGKLRQPEPVWIYQEALTLRSNWELEVVFKVFTE